MFLESDVSVLDPDDVKEEVTLPLLTDDVVDMDLVEVDVKLELLFSVPCESTTSVTPATMTSTGLRVRGLVAIWAVLR